MFKRNATDGHIENCEHYPICAGNLACPMEDCKLVRRTEPPREALPLEEGFFFGNFDHADDYCEECLDQTLKMLPRVIDSLNDGDELFYHARW